MEWIFNYQKEWDEITYSQKSIWNQISLKVNEENIFNLLVNIVPAHSLEEQGPDSI